MKFEDLEVWKRSSRLCADLYKHFQNIKDFHFVKTGGVGSPYIDIDIKSSLEILIVENPVPIPGAVWLLGSGLVGLMAIRRKKGPRVRGKIGSPLIINKQM